MRIVYAADNRYGSTLLLARFIEIVKPLGIELKVAAYRSSMGDFSVDWTLDALTNNFTSKPMYSHNGNFDYLKLEIERYKPDLLISDLEIYTSLAALDIGVELWLASPTLLYFALPKQTKISLGLSTKAKYALYSDQRKKAAMEKAIEGAKKRLIVSHIGDTGDIEIDKTFEIVRPEIHYGDGVMKTVQCEIEASDVFYNEQDVGFTELHNDVENMIVQAFADRKTISLKDSIKTLDAHIKMKL
jgi:hypothetical protein